MRAHNPKLPRKALKREILAHHVLENLYQNSTLERSESQQEKPPLHHYKRTDILINRGTIN